MDFSLEMARGRTPCSLPHGLASVFASCFGYFKANLAAGVSLFGYLTF